MKLLEKFVLILYSLLILIISVIICLIVFRIINFEQIKFCIDYVLNDGALAISVVGISILCMLLSVRCLFFRKKKQIKKSTTTDILLENDDGRLLISKTAIENAAKNIVKNALLLNTDMKVVADIDPANNISIYISIMLDRAIKVRELTLDLQLKIKNQIKEDFGLDVKQVNIKVDSDEKQIEKLEKSQIKEVKDFQGQKEVAKIDEVKNETSEDNGIKEFKVETNDYKNAEGVTDEIYKYTEVDNIKNETNEYEKSNDVKNQRDEYTEADEIK